MAINTALLKTTNDLQQYFVDKETGEPLAAGIVTLYRDNSRTYLKNWYYQTGQAPNYTYAALPNPLQLSSVGTVVDINGNDVLPFYYPVSETDGISPETYYITVDSADGTRQFTRQNFPFDGSTETPQAEISTLQNLIVNNNFWRNIGTQDLTTVTSTVSTFGLSPSAHDGFSMPDLQFFKDVAGATERVTFLQFAPGETPLMNKGDITPQYYLNHHCTASGTETIKYYQMPIVLSVKNLELETATFTIDAQSLGAPQNSILRIGIYQFPGSSNITPPVPTELFGGNFTLNSVWNKYHVTFKFPDASTVTTSDAGDDALYLIIFMPVSVSCNINFTQPSIYLGDTVPTNNFQTYDQSDSIINSPRTGDIRESFNSFSPFGWVSANGGTIGFTGSGADTTDGTWPLYNFFYQNCTDNVCPVSGTRTGNVYNDFKALKTLTLPNMMGRVTATQNSNIANLNAPRNITTATDTITFATGTNAGFSTGSPVQFINGVIPGASENTVYFVINPGAGSTIKVATTIENAFANVPITLGTSTGTPAIISALGILQGESEHTMTLDELVNHTHTLVNGGAVVTDQGAGAGVKEGTNSPPFNEVTSISPTGSTVPFNVIQPTIYMNKFIKL